MDCSDYERFRWTCLEKILRHGHNSGCEFHIRSDEARSGVNLFPDTVTEIDQHPSNPLSKWMQIIIDCEEMCTLQIGMVIFFVFLQIFVQFVEIKRFPDSG